MLDANEAFEKAQSKISNKTVEELEVCEKAINTAVDKGDVSCFVYQGLGKRAIRELRCLGYDVENLSSQKDGTMFQISWNVNARKRDI